MPLEPGSRLGPFRIESSLGAGGMGEVYRAVDTRLDRTVAIKVLPAHLSKDPGLRARFEREARAVSSLNHPHICTLHDVGREDGIDYLVMEYLEGETLSQHLVKGPLPTGQLVEVALQIAEALDAAHRQGLIHRDLKPGNIMLTQAGAKVLDFGLAKGIGATGGATSLTAAATATSPLTAEGTIVGTFQYMAPEQIEGKEADARSDIFSLGLLLYEMATGKPAFQGRTQASIIARILESEPEPIGALQPSSPPALDRLVHNCLAKDPDRRRQTMHDVALDLRWIGERGGSEQAVAPAAPASRRRERIAWALVIIMALAGAVIAGFRVLRQEPVPPTVRASIPAPAEARFYFVGEGPGGSGTVSVSPDGTKLAFVTRGTDGPDRLWVRPLDAIKALPLPGTDGARYPFWSPDSRTLAFFAGDKLRKIDTTGGPPLTLCQAPSGRSGSWGRAGVIVFAPERTGGLYQVNGAGGATRPATRFDEQKDDTHRWPFFLPDGRHFFYFVRAKGGGTNTVRIGSVDASTDSVLMQSDAQAIYASGYVLYLQESTLMARPFGPGDRAFTGEAFPVAEEIQIDANYNRGVFSASQNGVLAYQTGKARIGNRLLWLDRGGKQIGSLGERLLHLAPRLSPDGRSVAVEIADPSSGSEIWIYDIARGLRTRFTFDPDRDVSAVWSPDGEQIVFSSNRNGQYDLYEKSFGGSGEARLLLASDLDKFPSSWSPDGRFLAYLSIGDPDTRADVWVLPVKGAVEPIPFLRTEFVETHPAFSPDGRWMAYTSNESGRREVYVAPFPGPGRKWQISLNGGSFPAWGADGSEIFFVQDSSRLMAARVEAQGSSFIIGAVSELFSFQPGAPFRIYDRTGDGKRFLIAWAAESQTQEPLTLVVNWTSKLKH
ncbi:MAG: protein kinase [Acidobacteriota bacterium]